MFCGVEFFDLEVSAADEVVIANHDTGDGGKEDGVGGEVGGEVISARQQVPRAHDKTDEGADVASTTDVKVAGEESSHISSG